MPQLHHRAFDLGVLDRYASDPRYVVNTDDISGRLAARSDELDERDQISLQSFGYAFDKNGARFVAVFMRYLARLSSRHQAMWHSYEIDCETFLHPAYYDSAIRGSWQMDSVSVFDAFLLELQAVNDLCGLAGWPKLFRRDYRGELRPRKLSFLAVPSQAAFDEFALTLDKLMSDNIDIKFFPDTLRFDANGDPKTDAEGNRMGSIGILEDWIADWYAGASDELAKVIAVFRRVRKLRQKEAHKPPGLDTYDRNLQQAQVNLMKSVYAALMSIILALMKHPSTAEYRLEKPLSNTSVWFS